MVRKRHGRKLLIASIGVAAVSYVACGGTETTTSSSDAGITGGNGNAGGASGTGGKGTGGVGAGGSGGSSGAGGSVIVGNLMPMPVSDASVDASDARPEDAAEDPPIFSVDVVANLLPPPPPPDAKPDGT